MGTSGKRVLILCGSEETARTLSGQAELIRNYFRAEVVSLYYDIALCKTRLDRYDDTVLISSDLAMGDRSQIIEYCHKKDRKVYIMPSFYELFCAASTFHHVGEMPILQVKRLRQPLGYRICKRGLDLACAIIGLLCLWPLFLIIALAIKLDSPGPVLYVQERIGFNRVPFKILKFRTMHCDAEKYTGPILAAPNDPRVTGIGRLLRTARLDELPQLINVLSGQMSLVGPRPERPYFVARYLQQIPQYEYRFNVKPGITGLAQVYGRYDTSAADKLIYDLLYISKAGIMADVIILLRTIRVVVCSRSVHRSNHRTAPAESLSWGIIDN